MPAGALTVNQGAGVGGVTVRGGNESGERTRAACAAPVGHSER